MKKFLIFVLLGFILAIALILPCSATSYSYPPTGTPYYTTSIYREAYRGQTEVLIHYAPVYDPEADRISFVQLEQLGVLAAYNTQTTLYYNIYNRSYTYTFYGYSEGNPYSVLTIKDQGSEPVSYEISKTNSVRMYVSFPQDFVIDTDRFNAVNNPQRYVDTGRYSYNSMASLMTSYTIKSLKLYDNELMLIILVIPIVLCAISQLIKYLWRFFNRGSI